MRKTSKVQNVAATKIRGPFSMYSHVFSNTWLWVAELRKL